MKSDIVIRAATRDDLTFIDHLQKLNAEELAFYPNVVFEREVENHRIILALVGGLHAGYLYHGAFGATCKIHQACIEYDLRGQLYGSELVTFFVNLCKAANTHSVTLACGSDLLANQFWENMGFHCEGITQGGVRRMRDINRWRKDIHPNMFKIEMPPSHKEKDASIWRNRKISAPSQFIRGKAMKDYRNEIVKAQEKESK